MHTAEDQVRSGAALKSKNEAMNGDVRNGEAKEDIHDFDRYQDIFGQIRLLKSYTHFLLCFSVPDCSRESVTKALQSATRKLITTFPWLAGKVINEGSSPTSSGLFKVRPCSKWSPPNSILTIEDCSSLCPPYSEILAARGPIKTFDPTILAPTVAFPQSYQETESNPAFVAAIQANFVDSGLLLDVAGQHNIMDGVALLQMIKLLAKALRTEPFSPAEITAGNIDRRTMVPLLAPTEALHPVVESFRRPSTLSLSLPAVPAPHGVWNCFRFSASGLAKLKAQANNPEHLDIKIPYVSTDDALSAFIWQTLSSIRLSRLGDPSRVSKLTRAANARPALGVAEGYMGNMVTNSFNRLSLGELASFPLGKVASFMRKNLRDDVTADSVRSLVSLLERTEDKTTIMYGGVQDSEVDVAFSSLAVGDTAGVVFGERGKEGGLGRMDFLRRPSFIPKATTVYLWAKTERGDVDALICLKEQELEEVIKMGAWTEMAELIG